MVGINIGAKQMARARASPGSGPPCFGMTELIGLAAAIFPCLAGLFSDEPQVLALARSFAERRTAYGAVGLGLALYFASQGAKCVLLPVLAGTVRMIIAAFIAGRWSSGSRRPRLCSRSSRWRQPLTAF
jgi:Na+-driven multidrug efflux pump